MTVRSPLHQTHLRLGAKLVEFGGWEMPLQYEGIIAEHRAVRTRAGLFDVSHLGKVIVEGAGAEAALDRLLPGKVRGLAPWTAGYNLVLSESAGIVDDIFVYRHPKSFIVVPNAANTDAVIEVLKSVESDDVVVTDARRRWALIALSGPLARDIIAAKVRPAKTLRNHQFAEASLGKIPFLIARTGYTGETTFEFFVKWDKAEDLWEAIMKAGSRFGLKPAGLGARDLLRLEMGYPLHGHEITPDTNPLEAGLEWVIEWDKQFLGKPALEKIKERGPDRRLVGLVGMSRQIPRAGSRLMEGDVDVGEVVSGNYSPLLRAGIAMGYVRAHLEQEWAVLDAQMRGRSIPVRVTKPPFIPAKGVGPGRAAGGEGGEQPNLHTAR